MQFLKKLFRNKTKDVSPAPPEVTTAEEQKIIQKFREKFRISFRDETLLITAFKHRSYLNITNEERAASNERLEFLGDAVLDLVVTQYLYERFPKRTEGQLSKIKSVLVSQPVLADVATELSFGEMLLINRGEEKTGGRQRHSILSDAFEATIGAIYLDQGLSCTRDFIHSCLLSQFKKIIKGELYTNYKSVLLEHAQSSWNRPPEYRVVKEFGPDHDKNFVIGVFLNGNEIGRGEGKSKKFAEQEAAKLALEKLGVVKGEE